MCRRDNMYTILMATNMTTIDNEIPLIYVEYTHLPPQHRLQYHLLNATAEHPKEPFHRALKHIGTKCFRWDVLESVETEKEARKLLLYYIREYSADIIGYNRAVVPENWDEENANYGDNRTYEERYGKERAAEISAAISAKQTGQARPSTRLRNLMDNPMRDPAVREKMRQKHTGVKNPAAQFDYILTAEDGTVTVIDCLKDYCRHHTGFSKNGILKALREGRTYKGMTCKKVLKSDVDKQHQP
mgnify:FL=1|jgi:hypothetical protein